MDENLSINQDVFHHFLIEKLIELKTENSVHKYLLNAIVSELNPEGIVTLNQLPKEVMDALKFHATQSILDDLKIVSNDFDDLIQYFLNPS